eukprot:1614551-Rhodomonas_salina.1
MVLGKDQRKLIVGKCRLTKVGNKNPIAKSPQSLGSSCTVSVPERTSFQSGASVRGPLRIGGGSHRANLRLVKEAWRGVEVLKTAGSVRSVSPRHRTARAAADSFPDTAQGTRHTAQHTATSAEHTHCQHST